jgi:hypothetical protein
MFTIVDNTAAVQRFAANNSFNTEIGPATPSSALSIHGHAVLNGSALAQSVAAPSAMPRTTGSLTVAPNVVAIVSVPTSAGLASINGNGSVMKYNAAKTQMSVVSLNPNTSVSLGYGSF